MRWSVGGGQSSGCGGRAFEDGHSWVRIVQFFVRGARVFRDWRMLVRFGGGFGGFETAQRAARKLRGYGRRAALLGARLVRGSGLGGWGGEEPQRKTEENGGRQRRENGRGVVRNGSRALSPLSRNKRSAVIRARGARGSANQVAEGGEGVWGLAWKSASIWAWCSARRWAWSRALFFWWMRSSSSWRARWSVESAWGRE